MMTAQKFLETVKEHVTDTAPLTDAERHTLRTTTVQYIPNRPLRDLLADATHQCEFGVTAVGAKRKPYVNNAGDREVGPIKVFGHAFASHNPLHLAHTLIHEMAHCLAPKHPHDATWVEQCARLGIREFAYGSANDEFMSAKEGLQWKAAGHDMFEFSDHDLEKWVEGLGPIEWGEQNATDQELATDVRHTVARESAALELADLLGAAVSPSHKKDKVPQSGPAALSHRAVHVLPHRRGTWARWLQYHLPVLHSASGRDRYLPRRYGGTMSWLDFEFVVGFLAFLIVASAFAGLVLSWAYRCGSGC